MTKRRGLTRRKAIVGAALTPVAYPALARAPTRFSGGTTVSGAPPSITSVLINGSPSAASFQASAGNAPVGPITAPTSDGSFPTISITGNSEGFHPTSGTAGSMTLLAPSGGLSAGAYTDVTIHASGSYSNSPQSINPTLTALTTQNFVTGVVSLGADTPTHFGPFWEGMAITVGSTNLLVSALGRWIQTGNSHSHNLAIFDGPTGVQISATVTINPPYTSFGAFLYGTLASPVTLTSGRVYYIVSSETTDSGGDVNYQTDSSYTTTADAALTSGIFNTIPAGTWFTQGSANSMFGPIDFKYTLTSAPGVFPLSPFYPILARSNIQVELTPVQVVSGTVSIDFANVFNYRGTTAPVNSMVVQWVVDGNLTGPGTSGYITGPTTIFTSSGARFPYSLDTTALSDGTHSIHLRVIDADTSTGSPGPYQYQSSGSNLIVQNHGVINTSQVVPVTCSLNNLQRLYYPTPDFITYPGDTQRAVNTFDYPAPFAAPTYSSSSPFFATPADLRSQNNYYIEYTLALRNEEYEGDPAFNTTTAGGVFVGFTQNTNLGSSTSAAAPNVVRAAPWDGGRYDNRMTAIVIPVADPADGTTSGTATGVIAAEANGRIISLGYNGRITTLAGLTLDRATKLPYDAVTSRSYSDAQALSIFREVGTHSGFTQWWGINDLCFDPRDTTWNTIYIANETTHCIFRTTNLRGGSPTTILFAGVENTPGYAGDGSNVVSGGAGVAKFDQPKSIIMDPSGNLYIADFNNGAIRKIDSSGNLTTFAGNQTGKPALTAIDTYNETTLAPYSPPGLVAFSGTTGAYVNYPVAMRFNSTGDIVFAEDGCRCIRRIWLTGGHSGNISRIGTMQVTYDSGFGSFTWIDIDNPYYPINVAGGSPGTKGACGPLDDIMYILTPEGVGNATAGRMSIDPTNTTGSPSYNAIFSSDQGGMGLSQFGGTPWIEANENGWGTSLSEGFPPSLAGTFSDPYGVYTWITCFSKTQARVLSGGMRYIGAIWFREQLPGTDPALNMSGTNKDLLALGQNIFRVGTSTCFRPGARPSFALIHGMNGFGHLGSDVGPTIHDICVVYNGGNATYNPTLTTWGIGSMTLSAGHIAIVMSNTSGTLGVSSFVEQVGNFVDISGNGNATFNGWFKVTAYTDAAHFTIAAPSASGTSSGSPVINTGDATMQKFFVHGGTGSVPRPELGVAPGSSAINNDWVALSYFVRRATTAGSFPGPVALPGTLNTDTSAPQISNVVALRVNSTTISATWTTDKQTIGTLIGGSKWGALDTSVGTPWPYNVSSPIENGYGTSHSATLSGLPVNTLPTHYSILVKDEAGNTTYLSGQTIA